MMAGRTIAIGDIHGCLDALAALIDGFQPGPEDTVVTLGDLIDRGGWLYTPDTNTGRFWQTNRAGILRTSRMVGTMQSAGWHL